MNLRQAVEQSIDRHDSALAAKVVEYLRGGHLRFRGVPVLFETHKEVLMFFQRTRPEFSLAEFDALLADEAES